MILREKMIVNYCFHGIGPPTNRSEAGESLYRVSESRFGEMLDYVASHSSRAMVSFDDGNASDIELALPALRTRGLRASFFVVAGWIGRAGRLGRDDLQELVREGMTVGSHGMRHRPWRRLDAVGVEEELELARRLLEEAIERPIEVAAPPYGAYDRRIIRELRRRAYTQVFTVDGGPTREDAWLQARHAIRSTDTVRSMHLAGQPGTGLELARASKKLVKRWR
jgi:peptidoglycan/xylan/chitin deacetylase (PgdA/CDA1 family)